RNVHVVLHGGEPLLAGPAHLQAVLRTLVAHLADVTEVHFELQSNGILLTDQWLDLLEEFGVRTGISLDGPQWANDQHRLDFRRRSTWERTVRGIHLLRTRPALFAGLLAVVDIDSDPVAVHDFLASFEPPTIDFNLPHATHDRPPPRRQPDGAEYGGWLAAAYDAWISAERFTHTVR